MATISTEEHQKKIDEAEKRASRAERLVEKLKHEKYVSGQVRGFADFLREQSVVGLAIGIILGSQAKDLVGQFMDSFVNPLTYVLLPGKGALAQKTAWLNFGGKGASFAWGDFVLNLL